MKNTKLEILLIMFLMWPFLFISITDIQVFGAHPGIYNPSCRLPEKNAKYNEKYLLQYFDVEDTLYFNLKNLTLGEITKFIPLDDNSIAFIHDRIANSIYWSNLKTGSHKALSVENVVPGHKLQILATYKDPASSFWIASAPNYLFNFDENGNVIQHFTLSRNALSTKFCIDYNGNIIVYIDDKYPNYLSNLNSKNGEIRKLFDLKIAKKFKNLLFRMDGGGLLIDESQQIYFANPIENKIYKYDFNGVLLDVFKSRSKEYVLIEKDIPNDKKGLLAFFRSKPNFSSVLHMGFLNDELITIFYLIDGRADMEIFSKTSGEVINTERITILHSNIVGTGNNFLYLAHQPEASQGDTNIPNPFVIRFKFKPRAFTK